MEIIVLLILAVLGLLGSNSPNKRYRKYNQPKKKKPQNTWTYDFETGNDKDQVWGNLRQEILKRDSFKCRECGFQKNLTVHHVTPKYAGGLDEQENLITICASCHNKKHGRKVFDENKIFANKQKLTFKPSLKIQKINSAISSNGIIAIKYTDEKGKVTHRDIQPLRLFEEHGLLYVRANCHLRNAERTFRISRIISTNKKI